MKKVRATKPVAVLLVAAALSLGFSPAHATSVTFLTKGGDGSYVDSKTLVSAGLSVTLYGQEVINDNHGTVISTHTALGGLYLGSYNTGVKGYSTDSDRCIDGSSTTSTMDGETVYIHDEGILLSFGQEVYLTYLNFDRFSSSDDFNLTVDGTTLLVDFDEWETSPFARAVGTTYTKRDEYVFDFVKGKEFLIWADGSSDNFRLDRFEVDTAAPVPEPGTLLLLGTGLVGLTRTRRKTCG